LDSHGTGANVASPGLTPALTALVQGITPRAYRYDWMRDSALSMIALQRLLDSPVGRVGEHSHLTEEKVDKILRDYAKRQGRMILKHPGVAHDEEPKWTLRSNVPFSGAWCRPQTDGPGLRTMALMIFASRTHFKTGITHAYKEHLWRKIKFDLDWLSRSSNIHKQTCDLWEETTDTNFFWNKMTMRAALIMGHRFAQRMGDHHRSYLYLRAVERFIKNPVESHHQKFGQDQIYLTECSSVGEHKKCQDMGKDYDGAVILALIHSGWLDTPAIESAPLFPATLPTTSAVANTVRIQNEVSCKTYYMNKLDTERGISGVLYGRYPSDVYGGGNPWLLTTAALASLLYQAAQAVARGSDLTHEQLLAWREALQHHHFDGHASEFIAAGDSVLLRLRHHVEAHTTGWHLFEQIDKNTGKQTNARDLSWSYAEVLSAVRERDIAWGMLHDGQENHLEKHIILE